MSRPDNTQEEPQEARGAIGSRDTGEGPGGGPTSRPLGKADRDHHTGVNPLPPIDPAMPMLPSA